MGASTILLSRRSLRLPSWRLVLMVLLLGTGLILVGALRVHPFLARSEPSGGTVAVVEGWVSDAAIEHVASAYHSGVYRELYVSGLPIDRGRHLTEVETTDQLVIRSLAALGVNPAHVHSAAIREEVRADRTLRMAHRVGELFPRPAPDRFDVVTGGVHAYRPQLIYQRMIPASRVGVVSMPPGDYDPQAWWTSSAGFKAVVMELISVCYQFARGFDLPEDMGPEVSPAGEVLTTPR